MKDREDEQASLFDQPRHRTDKDARPVTRGELRRIPIARNDDLETSHESAADKNKRSRATNCNQILAHVRSHPGQVCSVISAEIGMEYHEVGRRVSDLINAGLAEYGEQEISPLTGKKCHSVWPVGQVPAVDLLGNRLSNREHEN